MKTKNKFLLFALIGICFSACSNNKDKNGKELSTTTTGEVKIAADETLLSIIDAQEQVFETIYPKANISAVYLPELDMMDLFIKDSISLVIAARGLNPSEMAYFKGKHSYTQNKIASDGIALIVNNQNTDTTFTLAQVREIMRGNFTDWNTLDKKSTLAKINLVFDNKNSGTVRYMAELVGQKSIPGYALKTNEEVIKYVSENKNALGIVGVNWISDKDDPKAMKFRSGINVVGIMGDPGDLGDDYYYQPYQAYFATKQYPLLREIYSISREPRAGLATGFASFISSDKGQKIILKSGLLPANAPIRIIQTN
jgi:phosphate transport system substrate-binding protein